MQRVKLQVLSKEH